MLPDRDNIDVSVQYRWFFEPISRTLRNVHVSYWTSKISNAWYGLDKRPTQHTRFLSVSLSDFMVDADMYSPREGGHSRRKLSENQAPPIPLSLWVWFE